MTHRIKDWYQKHEGWFMVFIISAAMFSAGYMSAERETQRALHEQSVAMQKTYDIAITAKDALISQLAKTNATTSGNAANAAQVAANASQTASQAAATVDKIAKTDQKALEKIK